MVRTPALPLSPATAAWGALVELASRASQRPDASAALELVRSLARPRMVARRRARVPAGSAIEVLQAPTTGAPHLQPAPGALPSLETGSEPRRIFRASEGRLEGREVAPGTLVVVAQRPAARGDWVVVAGRRALRLVAWNAPRRLSEEGRVIGVVEALVGEAAGRRSA